MNSRSRAAAAVLVGLALVCGRAGAAQEQAEGAKAAPKGDARADAARTERAAPRPDPRYVASATLRVQLVISRYQNDKKQASLPYTFLVGAKPSTNPGGNRVRMRMGIDTPVPSVTYDESGKPKSTGIQYRNVGTNIDCWATDLTDGHYQLNLQVENSSAVAPGPGTSAREDLGGAPMFRRFETFIDPILRDGQTVQTVASTDPVTGEVVKIDVTLNVVK
jgi:hypothetical protein